MASYNRIIMAGNLTKDPEYKQVAGTSVCRLNIASNRKFKNKQGTLTQEVCYIEVDVWGNQADNCNKYLQKGRPVLVEGRLKLDSWEQDGQPRRKHLIVADSVVFLSSAQASSYDNDDSFSSSSNNYGQKNTSSNTNNSDDIIFKDEPPFEDELPF